MGKYSIEVCANSADSALNAQRGGAARVELCAGLIEGGTTPSIGEVSETHDYLYKTKLNILIRPRGGDFCYSPREVRIMDHDITILGLAPINAFVFGCLTPEGDVDMYVMKKLIKKCRGSSVTFHRAFDMCRDPFQALEDIIALGCDRILTSGQRATAEEGIPLIRKLIEQAAGRIIIMPGGGITPKNIKKIAEETGATEFHLSGRRAVRSSNHYRNPLVSLSGITRIDEYTRYATSKTIVKNALKALND